jgi:hypothetical protein
MAVAADLHRRFLIIGYHTKPIRKLNLRELRYSLKLNKSISLLLDTFYYILFIKSRKFVLKVEISLLGLLF